MVKVDEKPMGMHRPQVRVNVHMMRKIALNMEHL